jgi:hypothetical protein
MAMPSLQHQAVAERMSGEMLVLLGTLMYVKLHKSTTHHNNMNVSPARLQKKQYWQTRKIGGLWHVFLPIVE